MFYGSFKGVSRKYQGCFIKVSFKRKFQGCFKGVLWILRMFPECFKEVSRKLSRSFRKVSCCMVLIAASRAEGGLVFLIQGWYLVFVKLLLRAWPNV